MHRYMLSDSESAPLPYALLHDIHLPRRLRIGLVIFLMMSIYMPSGICIGLSMAMSTDVSVDLIGLEETMGYRKDCALG